MAKARIAWKHGAFALLRTEPAFVNRLAEEAEIMAEEAGEGYESNVGITGGRIRGRASVFTATPAAIADNAERHTLLRILAGRTGLVEYVSKSGKKSWITKKQYANYMRRRKS